MLLKKTVLNMARINNMAKWDKEKKQTSIYVIKKDVEIYERMYPKTLGMFIQKAMRLAITNNEFFYKTISTPINED